MSPQHRCRQRDSFELPGFPGCAEDRRSHRLIDVHIQKRAAASQGKGYLRSLLLMGLQEPLQGKIGHHIAVVAEDGLVLVQEIFNVFQSACRVQKDWFMAKE